MGGRGTFAAGNPVPYVYKTVDKIHDVKVLVGTEKSGEHGLPAEAHYSWAYIKLKPNGVFHEMRIYDKDHYLIREIGYHPEPSINNGNRRDPILHVHEYPERDNFHNRKPHKITRKEYEMYKKYQFSKENL